jgi:hypothetical protein
VFALARVTVTADFDVNRLTDTLIGRGVPVGRHRERLRTRLWRQVRRRSYRQTEKAAA